MRRLIIILTFLITSSTTSWAQENDEERLDKVIELQGQAKDVRTLKQAWSSYKLGNYEDALGLWMPLAESGNPSAQVLVGLMYNQGNFVKQDNNEAEKWYVLASKQDFVPAKWRLAMLYYHGSGLTQNYQKAADLYHSAAKQGDVYSQKALGEMYSKGFGVTKDNILAYIWFQISKDNGFNLAQKYQDTVARGLSPEEIILAQAMVKECKNSNYKRCGWTVRAEEAPNKDDS